MEQGQLLVIWYLVFVFSATFHEAAHAFVAMKGGDYTAYHGGQVTLNPMPHIKREPLGMVIVPLVSFFLAGWMMGWASAPYDPYWAQRNPRRAAWMGLAGPGANLLLVIVAGILIHIGIAAGLFFAPDSIRFINVVESTSDGLAKALAVMLSVMFTLNLVLFAFNLIPIAPLDGTCIMQLALKGEQLYKYNAAMANPTVRLVGFIIAWHVFDYIFTPIHIIALNILYPGSGYGFG